MAQVTLPMDRALALELLLNRLFWPVPLVRWRAARSVRDLIEDRHTREASTDALLAALTAAELESDVCTILTVLLMVDETARPDFLRVRHSIRQPSVLAEILLQEIYHQVAGTEWWRGNSGAAPLNFEPIDYFERYQTSHVPVVLSNNLRDLESKSGLPLMRQWAYEWQQLCTSINAQYTEYPFYFSDFGEFRDGIVGQFSPRQSELYRSAYLRTFSLAVSEWGFPQSEAGFYVSELLPSIRGLFELDPVGRPDWLEDLPERCVSEPDRLEAILRALVASQPDVNQAIISLHIPLNATVERFGNLNLTSHLVSSDFIPSDTFLRERIELLFAHRSFSLDQELTETSTSKSLHPGQSGDALPTSCTLFPIPFGHWQAHLHGAGIPIPASYMLPKRARVHGMRDRIAIEADNLEVAATRYWLDHWSPNYPRDEGNTRCGSWAMLDRQLLETQTAASGRKLGWSARLTTWRREKDYGEFKRVERTLFFCT